MRAIRFWQKYGYSRKFAMAFSRLLHKEARIENRELRDEISKITGLHARAVNKKIRLNRKKKTWDD